MPYARDVQNLTLRPETVTNVPLYVGFELRNRNQHAKMVVFDTKIEINILILKSINSEKFEIKIKTEMSLDALFKTETKTNRRSYLVTMTS